MCYYLGNDITKTKVLAGIAESGYEQTNISEFTGYKEVTVDVSEYNYICICPREDGNTNFSLEII